MDLGKAIIAHAQAEQQAQHADNDLALVRAELRALAEQKAVCPTCGAELDPERLIAHAAAHGGDGHA
jgi:DNA repair exonuclease SbcCD ATPase subunit